MSETQNASRWVDQARQNKIQDLLSEVPTMSGGAEIPLPRRFHLVRREDLTGISGTGIVAEGIQYTDGVVAMRWIAPGKDERSDKVRPTTVLHDDIDSVVALHGHEGRTWVKWVDDEEEQAS